MAFGADEDECLLRYNILGCIKVIMGLYPLIIKVLVGYHPNVYIDDFSRHQSCRIPARPAMEMAFQVPTNRH